MTASQPRIRLEECSMVYLGGLAELWRVKAKAREERKRLMEIWQ